MMKRLARLDALRAYCVLGVFLFHAGLCDFGWMGVQLFFVLSGFLITGVLLDEKSARVASTFFAGFYARRALRIFPAYYAYLLVVVAAIALNLAPAAQAGSFSAEFPYLVAYLENLRVFAPGYDNAPLYSHLWTLSLEEQFYLAWPLAIWLTSAARLVPLCLATLVAGVVFRVGFSTYAFISAPDTAFLAVAVPRAPPCAIDAFAIGALAMLARGGAEHAMRRAVRACVGASLCAGAASAVLALAFVGADAFQSAIASGKLTELAIYVFDIPMINLLGAMLILALSSEAEPQDRALRLFDITLMQRLGA